MSDRAADVRAASFRGLLDTGKPVTAEQLAAATGVFVEDVLRGIDELDAQGMVRVIDGEIVIFVAARDDGARVVDDWCPTVNFFEDASTATMWAAGRAGAVVSAGHVAEQSAPAWAALLRAG